MLYLNKISCHAGFWVVYNAFSTKALPVVIYYMWETRMFPKTRQTPIFFFLSKEGLKLLTVWQWQLYFLYFNLPLASFSSPVLSLPCEPASILLFRSLSAAESRADVTNLVLCRNRPNQTKVFHLIDSWPSGSLWTRNWPASPFPFLSLFVATVGFQSAERASAKKHFISDPIISSA